jgi:hypothetical protein
MSLNGKVPMFKMRPAMGTLVAAICVLLLGVTFFIEGHRDKGDLAAHELSNLVLAVSIVVAGLLLIISTGRMWFGHLWHDRYK